MSEGSDCMGIPWFLGSNRVNRYKREFIKRGKEVVEDLMDGYEVLANFVYRENKPALRLLRWLGFTIHVARS